MSLQIIELDEYIPLKLAQEKIPIEVGKYLRKQHGNKVFVEFPSIGTDNCWRLISRGWVGFIPLTQEITLRLVPKVQIGNLFQMLEYAYGININFQNDLISCASIEDFYERLAQLLALRIMKRAQQGFYRTYISAIEHSSCVKGRLEVKFINLGKLS